MIATKTKKSPNISRVTSPRTNHTAIMIQGMSSQHRRRVGTPFSDCIFFVGLCFLRPVVFGPSKNNKIVCAFA